MPTERIMVSVPDDLAKAVRKKSKQTGVPVSYIVQRAFAWWLKTGEVAPDAEKVWQSGNENNQAQGKQSK